MPVDSQRYQAEQDGAPARRDAQGRWRKGASGNPAGRRRGALNEATRLAKALLDEAAPSLIEKVIEKALAGDAVAMRFCLARLLAPRRHSSVEFDLPPLDTAKDAASAISAVGKAAADGVIAPAEALEFARVVDTAIRALAARENEKLVEARREVLKEGKLPLF
jgi:hypothetical protein